MQIELPIRCSRSRSGRREGVVDRPGAAAALGKRLCSVALAVMMSAHASLAAEVTTKPVQGTNLYSISIEGPITQGDSEKFVRALLAVPAVGDVELNSPGGDVVEAMRVGEIVSAARLGTSAAPHGICASACAFIWLNGATRLASSNPMFLGKLGLHRPYLPAPQNTQDSLKRQALLQRAVAEYMDSKLVPRKFIDLMMTRPSNMVYWMSDADLGELGTTPPELEELYVARCGYNMRELIQQRRVALFSSGEDLHRIDERMSQLMLCAARLNLPVQRDALARLQAGWRPELSVFNMR